MFVLLLRICCRRFIAVIAVVAELSLSPFLLFMVLLLFWMFAAAVVNIVDVVFLFSRSHVSTCYFVDDEVVLVADVVDVDGVHVAVPLLLFLQCLPF